MDTKGQDRSPEGLRQETPQEHVRDLDSNLGSETVNEAIDSLRNAESTNHRAGRICRGMGDPQVAESFEHAAANARRGIDEILKATGY